MRLFRLLTCCLALGGLAVLLTAGSAHAAPTYGFNCATYTFDPEPGQVLKVTVQVDTNGDNLPDAEQTGSYVTDDQHTVTIPVEGLVAGKAGQWRAGLPEWSDQFTGWAPFDCRPDPSISVSADCAGWNLTWADLRNEGNTDLHIDANYQTDGPVSQDLRISGTSGQYSFPYPTSKNQSVTVHVTGDGLSADTGTTLTCAPPPAPPEVIPPAEVTKIAQGPGDTGDLATTGSDALPLFLGAVAALSFGSALILRTRGAWS